MGTPFAAFSPAVWKSLVFASKLPAKRFFGKNVPCLYPDNQDDFTGNTNGDF
jgi:hypothetical protein